MAIAKISLPAEGEVIETDWRGYLRIRKALEGRRVLVTYDRGRLEIVSPSDEHEDVKRLISHLVEVMLDELNMESWPGGSPTLGRRGLQRALEPDECYWIAHWEAVVKKVSPRPPPDLAIEVEISHTVLDRLTIYEALGVPEIWRWTVDGRLMFLLRTPAGLYQERPTSGVFPWLQANRVPPQIERGRHLGRLAWRRELVPWIRQQSQG